ncbi:MAG: oxygenase MpaB family protein [Halioglobus sp.]|nr:oxygenase MpaB family protein [Halioglobus sp.]
MELLSMRENKNMVPSKPSMYRDCVLKQKEAIPAIYGDVDFSRLPERYVSGAGLENSLPRRYKRYAASALSDPERVANIRNYTMMGDGVADAYAALIPEYGFRALVAMLEEACENGIEAVFNPPKELVTFIHAMEATPDWVDMDLVEKGARQERIPLVTISPFAIRGAFIATFMNKYTALPMTMTGTLSDSKSARRVLETASFFTATAMPGAMTRFGRGFQAAAKVRLMHSMVRFNIMQSGEWDVATYGIPIPQVDQMPAGLIGIFLLSFKLLSKGRTHFTPAERERVEMARYRCFLLGLPHDLLGETPQEIVDLIMARALSLREEFDDDTCGVLVRGTMDAELLDDPSVRGRFHSWMERGFSKYFLIQNFCDGKSARAEKIGIHYRFEDKLATGVTILVILASSGFYTLGMRIPGLSRLLDKQLVSKIATLLDSYGHADFITNASEYKLSAAK